MYSVYMYCSLYGVLLLYTSFAVLRPAVADREQAFPAFMEWLHKNGVDTSAVEIHSFPGCGYGLKAVKDIKVKQSVCLSVCLLPVYFQSLVLANFAMYVFAFPDVVC